MDNKIAQLAYDASVRAIQDQAGVLDGLRTRAGTVLAAAALVSSFLGGQALRDSSHLELLSLTTAAVGELRRVLALQLEWNRGGPTSQSRIPAAVGTAAKSRDWNSAAAGASRPDL